MEERVKLECWSCEKEFSLFLAFEDDPRFYKECPFCGEGVIIDLDPYRRSEKVIMKGRESDVQQSGFIFPEVIPTSKPSQE